MTIKEYVKENCKSGDDIFAVFVDGKCCEYDFLSDWYLSRLCRFKYRNAEIDHVEIDEMNGHMRTIVFVKEE